MLADSGHTVASSGRLLDQHTSRSGGPRGRRLGRTSSTDTEVTFRLACHRLWHPSLRKSANVRHRTDAAAADGPSSGTSIAVTVVDARPVQLPELNMDPTRVLVVDDNETFIEMAKFVLTAAGYVVDAASDAGSAQAMIPVFLPDVILMDIQMPVTDGIELTKRLKADPATRHIPVIAFTAYASKGEGNDLKAAGFDGYIGKPVDVMTLAAEVRFWLEGPGSARSSRFVWP